MFSLYTYVSVNSIPHTPASILKLEGRGGGDVHEGDVDHSLFALPFEVGAGASSSAAAADQPLPRLSYGNRLFGRKNLSVALFLAFSSYAGIVCTRPTISDPDDVPKF